MNAKEFHNKYGYDSCIFDINSKHDLVTTKDNLDSYKNDLKKYNKIIELIKAKIKFFEDELKLKEKKQ